MFFILSLTGEEKERSDFFLGGGRGRNVLGESESPELVRVKITSLSCAEGPGAKVTI